MYDTGTRGRPDRATEGGPVTEPSKRQQEFDELLERALAEPGVAQSLRLWESVRETGSLGLTYRQSVVRGYSSGANEPCAYLG